MTAAAARRGRRGRHGRPDLVGEAARRTVVTPEGVPLHLEIGRAGDRVVAFVLDSVLLFGTVTVLLVLTLDASRDGGSSWLGTLVLLAVFLLQNFYFIYFESRERGATPGKRRTHLRVIDASGGALTAQAVVVRNVMRNLEFYLPLAALLAPDQFWPGLPGWAQLLAATWMLVLAGLPFFNRYRLRVGDIVAGTMVVREPRVALLSDLGQRGAAQKTAAATRFSFSEAQLDIYGEYELLVLEDVLRDEKGSPDGARTMAAVADQIAKKIDYAEQILPKDRRTFLMEFYAALRARLEQRRMFGRRKADKYEPS